VLNYYALPLYAGKPLYAAKLLYPLCCETTLSYMLSILYAMKLHLTPQACMLSYYTLPLYALELHLTPVCSSITPHPCMLNLYLNSG